MKEENDYKLIEKSIENTRTKYCKDILEFLYKYPNTRQIDIARKLGIPSSNLQGVMKKLLRADPALILNTGISGKGYMLSPKAEEYLDWIHGNNSDISIQNPLEKWILINGNREWKSKLNSVLKENANMTLMQQKIFNELIIYVKSHGLAELENLLDKELQTKICNYIGRKKFDTQALCKMYADGWEQTFRLVDYVFEYFVYEDKDEMFQIYKAFDLESEDAYIEIKSVLLHMVDEGKKILKGKEDIYRMLEKDMQECELLAFYIAEKIYSFHSVIQKKIIETEVINEE